jgi:hypothetical protein
VTIAASTAALAQRPEHRHDGARRGPPTAEEMRAFADARLAALKAGLQLTEQQAAHWPAFEQAMREWQKLRADRALARMQQRSEAATPSADPAARLRQRGMRMADTGAAMKKLGDAMEPLYKNLDDNQKRRFAALSRMGGPRASFAGRGGRAEGGPAFRGRDGRGSGHHHHGRDFRGPGGFAPGEYRRGSRRDG